MEQPFDADSFIAGRLMELKAAYGIRDAIETGTCHGATARWLADNFERCFTIELDPDRVRTSISLGTRPNLAFYCGSSPDVLRAIAPLNSHTPLVYLDAHWNDYWPLLDELSALTLLKQPPVIVIHDFKVPGEPSLGFDSYAGIDLDLDYIREGIDRLYGTAGCSHEFNSGQTSAGARRGVIYLIPNPKPLS